MPVRYERPKKARAKRHKRKMMDPVILGALHDRLRNATRRAVGDNWGKLFESADNDASGTIEADEMPDAPECVFKRERERESLGECAHMIASPFSFFFSTTQKTSYVGELDVTQAEADSRETDTHGVSLLCVRVARLRHRETRPAERSHVIKSPRGGFVVLETRHDVCLHCR